MSSGHAAPGQAQRVRNPARDLVAAAEDRVHASRRAQQQVGGLPPPCLTPLAIEHVGGPEVRPGRGDRVAEAAGALAGTQEPFRAGDVPEPAAAHGQQVLGRHPPAADVVGQDRGLVTVQRLRHRVDHGHAKARADARPGLDPAPGHDQPVHLTAEQHVEVAALTVRLVPRVAHEHGDLAHAQGVLRAEHDRDAEPPEAVGGDHADGVGAPCQAVPGRACWARSRVRGLPRRPGPWSRHGVCPGRSGPWKRFRSRRPPWRRRHGW